MKILVILGVFFLFLGASLQVCAVEPKTLFLAQTYQEWRKAVKAPTDDAAALEFIKQALPLAFFQGYIYSFDEFQQVLEYLRQRGQTTGRLSINEKEFIGLVYEGLKNWRGQINPKTGRPVIGDFELLAATVGLARIYGHGASFNWSMLIRENPSEGTFQRVDYPGASGVNFVLVKESGGEDLGIMAKVREEEFPIPKEIVWKRRELIDQTWDFGRFAQHPDEFKEISFILGPDGEQVYMLTLNDPRFKISAEAELHPELLPEELKIPIPVEIIGGNIYDLSAGLSVEVRLTPRGQSVAARIKNTDYLRELKVLKDSCSKLLSRANNGVQVGEENAIEVSHRGVTVFNVQADQMTFKRPAVVHQINFTVQ